MTLPLPSHVPTAKLVRYEAARAALAEAHAVDEVKDIRDKALAIAAYAKQANDTAMVEWATEIKVRAERRAGELLSVGQESGDVAGRGRPAADTKSVTLTDLGVTENQSRRWKKLAAVPAEQFEHAIEAAKEVAREVTTTGVLKIAEQVAAETNPQKAPEWYQPADHTGSRWSKNLHDLWVQINGVRDNGGIERVAAGWTPENRAGYIEELDHMIDLLTAIRESLQRNTAA